MVRLYFNDFFLASRRPWTPDILIIAKIKRESAFEFTKIMLTFDRNHAYRTRWPGTRALKKHVFLHVMYTAYLFSEYTYFFKFFFYSNSRLQEKVNILNDINISYISSKISSSWSVNNHPIFIIYANKLVRWSRDFFFDNKHHQILLNNIQKSSMLIGSTFFIALLTNLM